MSVRLFLLIFFGCIVQPVLAQSCFTIFAGNDTTISCSQSCLTLKALIPDIRSSEDYKVISIPYQPFPYRTGGPGLAIPEVAGSQDDRFSKVINLPYNFCFFGTNYNQFVVGSNGVVSFELENAGQFNNYTLLLNSQSSGRPVPLFYSGGGAITNTGTATTRYPKASIFGVYYDMEPRVADTTWKIEGRLEGNSNCRKYVISFDHISMFGCNSLFATSEIVLQEGTGIIDVFVQDRPICSTSSDGNAIIGIQNYNRDYAVTPVDRNCTNTWGKNGRSINEAWRFVPNGTTSLFKKVELFQGNTFIALGDTVSLGTGELSVRFNNICTTQDTSAYRVVATYARCDDPNSLITAEDTIQVFRTGSEDVVASFTPASCANGGTGVITVSSPVGPNYEYSVDGVNYQSSPTFSLPAGTYLIKTRNTLTPCVGSTSVTVPIIETIRFSTSTSNATCYGAANGQVLVITQAGAQPFQYSADGGISYQGSNLLLLPAGTHTIRVKDNNNCTKDTVITVGQPDSISIAPPVINAAYCSGNPDGQIIINATGGTPSYRYSLNNTIYQTSSTLAVNVGSYTVYVKDNNGCVYSKTGITVPLNDTMRLQPLPDTSLCIGSSININPNTNATAFSWSPNAFISDTTSGRPVISPQDTITYYLQARLGTLCSRTDTFTVDVLKRPIPDAGPDTTICFGTQAFFHATAVRGNKYRWTPAANLSNPTIPDPRATGFIPINYILEVTDPYGCGFKEYDTIKLTVRPKVRAFAGQDTTATLGTPVQLFGCCMDLYQWSPTSVFVNDTARNPIGNFPAGTTQVVMITTTPEGCEGRDTMLVKGYQGPTYYVPSAFTPGNRDGVNDVFRPIPVGITETYYFSVFNRFGQLIYTTKTFLEGWDGRFKGELQANGAYVWMVKGKGIDGKIVEKRGTVVLMR